MPKQTTDAVASQKRRPIHTIRHRSIKVTIWRNETAKGSMYNVIASRSYREGEGWKDTHSFGFDDLMNVAKVLSDAHSFISTLMAKERAGRPKQRPMREPGED